MMHATHMFRSFLSEIHTYRKIKPEILQLIFHITCQAIPRLSVTLYMIPNLIIDNELKIT
jgi:hypothetical protein